MTAIKNHREIDAAAKVIADWRSMMIVHAIFENGPIRYTDLAESLTLSPTVLSSKLTQLTTIGIISRHKQAGVKEVAYAARPLAGNMVKAYHLLEEINDLLTDDVNRQKGAQ